MIQRVMATWAIPRLAFVAGSSRSSIDLPVQLISSLHSLRSGRELSQVPQGHLTTQDTVPPEVIGKKAWRYELKYVVAHHIRARLTADLSAFVQRDAYSDDRGYYLVRSLYLDTSDLRCLSEKSAGLMNRRKLRIRTYPEAGAPAAIKFEIKHRVRSRILKTVAEVDRTTYEVLRAGLSTKRMADADVIASNPSLRPFFYFKQARGMVPVVNVQFRRQAFHARHDRGVRITLDDALIGCRARDVFEPVHRSRRLSPGTGCILEIKVERSLPFWLSRLITKYNLRLRSVSKYSHVAELGLGWTP